MTDQKKKRTSYSFAIKRTDNPKLIEFINNQVNFSEAIRCLIYSHIYAHGTGDISYQLSEVLYSDRKYQSADSTKEIVVDTIVEENIISETPNKLLNKKVPDCYK